MKKLSASAHGPFSRSGNERLTGGTEARTANRFESADQDPKNQGATMRTAVRTTGVRRGGTARIVPVLLVVWLIIGALAAGQRDYFSGSVENCAKTGTILLTIIAGPLNYVGLNPKIESCEVPQPSG